MDQCSLGSSSAATDENDEDEDDLVFFDARESQFTTLSFQLETKKSYENGLLHSLHAI